MTAIAWTAALLQQTLTKALNGSVEEIEATAAAYFSPHYIQVTDGKELTFSAFREHLMSLHRMVKKVEVEVLFFLCDGTKLADRHVVKVEKLDGNKVTIEVLLLGELDETGRLIKVWETSRQIDGTIDASDMANA